MLCVHCWQPLEGFHINIQELMHDDCVKLEDYDQMKSDLEGSDKEIELLQDEVDNYHLSGYSDCKQERDDAQDKLDRILEIIES